MGRRDRERARRALERERNGAYGGRREDGWKAGDKLSFRQQSRMCVGRKTHFLARGQRTRGLTGRFEGGKQGQDAREEERGKNDCREEERGKGNGRRKGEG